MRVTIPSWASSAISIATADSACTTARSTSAAANATGADVGATVTAASPEVVERTVGGANRVFLPSGEMGVAWGLGVGVSGRITAQVTGNGVLEMYVGDDEEPTHWWTAGSPELFKWRSTVADANLRFRYLPGEGDTGGAYVKSFETRGMTLIVR